MLWGGLAGDFSPSALQRTGDPAGSEEPGRALCVDSEFDPAGLDPGRVTHSPLVPEPRVLRDNL